MEVYIPGKDLLTDLKKRGAIIGKNVYIGLNVFVELENAKFLTIEDDVVIAAFTKIILHDSSLNNVTDDDIIYGKVVLKRNCYIGADSILLPGAVIGENSIIGAGSLVKGSVKSNSVYMGRPAKYYCSIKQLSLKCKKNKIMEKFKIKKKFFYITSKKWYKRNPQDEADLEIEKSKIKP